MDNIIKLNFLAAMELLLKNKVCKKCDKVMTAKMIGEDMDGNKTAFIMCGPCYPGW